MFFVPKSFLMELIEALIPSFIDLKHCYLYFHNRIIIYLSFLWDSLISLLKCDIFVMLYD